MLVRALFEYALPTLARLKLGSLFTVPAAPSLAGEMADLNAQLPPKCLELLLLRLLDGRALMYVYRRAMLSQALEDGDTWRYLQACGYGARTTDAVLEHLRERLSGSDDFPHEIGVFLGYPLADVIGFIENGGRNCLCCGCWKVYANACDAQQAFARFRKCKAVYERLFASGCPLTRLMVSAKPA